MKARIKDRPQQHRQAEPQTEKRKCPKCGGKMGQLVYCKGNQTMVCKTGVCLDEHLYCKCRVCGYIQALPCLDAGNRTR